MLELIDNSDITKLSTLRVVASAEKLCYPSNIEELEEIFHYIQEHNLAFNILGAGSNTLLSSVPLKGVLVSTNHLDFIAKIDDGLYEVGAGLRMPKFCALMTREELSGTEFMEGIPGSIGGGIVMNAGAHGSEISKILIAAKILDLETFEITIWSNKQHPRFQAYPEFANDPMIDRDLDFSYRHSGINPKKEIIISGIFALEHSNKESIRETVQHNNSARTSSQPIKAYTCGCTFQNPSGIGAGKLIDELGLKGNRQGDFIISNTHGNFFENLGSGTSHDFCKLMLHVQNEAKRQKNIDLKPEVKPMGEFTEEEKQIWK